MLNKHALKKRKLLDAQSSPSPGPFPRLFSAVRSFPVVLALQTHSHPAQGQRLALKDNIVPRPFSPSLP